MKSNAQPVSGTAAGEFCQGYWYPLYSFLRHSGYREADAQDHVQSFLASLLDSNLLASADPAQGRLRNFLITLLTRHISAYRKRQRAQKRGGGIPAIPLDWSVAEAAYQRQGTKLGSPEEAYRHALATQLVAEGISTVQSHYAAAGQQSLCEELLPALEGPLPDGTFDALATRLNLRPGTVRAAAVRMRARFRLAVRESAAPLLGLPVGPALDAELREIFCGSAQPTGL